MSLAYAKVVLRPLIAALLLLNFLPAAHAAAGPETPGAIAHQEVPVDAFGVTVAPGARDAYFALLRRFSDKYEFAIRIAPTTASGEDFVVQMFREDIKVRSTNAPTRDRFSLVFYATCEFENAITKENIAVMVADLKTMLSKTKGLSVEPNI